MTREEAIEVYNGLINTKIKEAFEFFAPELRESEDERIRKVMLEHFKCKTKETWCGLPVVDIIAYLKKQKEQKPDDDPLNDPKFIKGFDTGREVQRIFDEKKPAECLEKGNEYWLGFNEGKGTVLDNPEQYGLCKPAKWNVEDKVIRKEIQDYFNKKKDYRSRWFNWVSRATTYKPAEWSKEDERMLLSIINAFRNGTVSTIGQEQWLKSLPERFNPQPKQEWNEQNKKWFDAIIKDYEESLSGDEEHDPAIQIKINLLKSLRPSWKPSEEQMKTLRNAIALAAGNKVLAGLYEQLKKLM